MKKSKKTTQKPIVDRDRFIESVYHIVFLGNTIRNFDNVLLSIADKISSREKIVIRYSIQWNALISTVSLFDELNKYLLVFDPVDKDLKRKIRSYKYIIDPILTSIDKWVDIRKFRNNVLAHSFRVDSDGFKSVHLSSKLNTYNIPDSIIDLATLFKYFGMITKIAEEIFLIEFREAKKIVDNCRNRSTRIPQSLELETQKVNAIVQEVNKRIKDYNMGL